jgi:hypothetical protein
MTDHPALESFELSDPAGLGDPGLQVLDGPSNFHFQTIGEPRNLGGLC